MYTVGDIAAQVNISKDAVRYYDEIGLLKPHAVNPDNQYRTYTQEQVGRLLQILEYKSYGCSLAEIKSLLAAEEGERLVLLGERRRLLRAQIQTLAETERKLSSVLFLTEANKMKPKMMMVVDDAPFMRKIMVEILDKHGFTTIDTDSGQRVLDNWQDSMPSARPDFYFIDIAMPEMDGIDLVRGLTALGCDKPMVMISAHGDAASVKAALEAGAWDFVVKPFHQETIYEMIQKYAGRAKPDRSAYISVLALTAVDGHELLSQAEISKYLD